MLSFLSQTGRRVKPSNSRAVPLSCHVQQKTVWKSNNRIKVRLSSAERLAKELKPSFIYVLQIDDDLSVVDAWLIHLLDEPLYFILKRLRKEEQRKTSGINKLYISFDFSKFGSKLVPLGYALRDAILTACKVNLHSYVEKKQDQLLKLGFDSGRYRTQLTIPLESERDLIDTFLGIKKGSRGKRCKDF